MTMQVRGRSKALTIGLIVLVLAVVVLPIGYAYATFNAVRKLIIHTPSVEVTRDGWSIYITLSIVVENPTNTPIPTLNILFNCSLNNHVLFYSEQRQIGSLDPYSTVTLRFTTVVNFGLFADLFWTLVDYLAGNPVSYYFCLSISMHLLIDIPVFEIKREGTWELY